MSPLDLQPAEPPPARLWIGEVCFVVDGALLRSPSATAQLTVGEADLLKALLRWPLGTTITRSRLMTVLWEDRADPPQNRALDSQMLRLRQKLAKVSARVSIDSIFGVGYQIHVPYPELVTCPLCGGPIKAPGRGC